MHSAVGSNRKECGIVVKEERVYLFCSWQSSTDYKVEPMSFRVEKGGVNTFPFKKRRGIPGFSSESLKSTVICLRQVFWLTLSNNCLPDPKSGSVAWLVCYLSSEITATGIAPDLHRIPFSL